jgi:arabinogalactan oligomer/maltooligosaccharide transport system substrate-binding protein
VFVTAAQAGKGPDLVMGAHDWIGNLVQNGTIDPLQLTDDTRAAFNELALQGVTYNGQIYGNPLRHRERGPVPQHRPRP